MQPEIIHGQQATRRDSLKRLSAGVIGLSALASHGHSNASSGFSAQGLKRIAPSMKFQIDQGIFPGAVSLVAHKGKTVHFEAHGYRDAAKSRAMSKDSIFRLASMTKPIVTTAAMMLVEQGKLRLNDPVVKWLPELKNLQGVLDSSEGFF